MEETQEITLHLTNVQNQARWAFLINEARMHIKALIPVTRRANVNITSSGNLLSGEREKLIMEIAELDDRFEAGEIAEDEYRNIRSDKKNKLVSVTERIKKIGV